MADIHEGLTKKERHDLILENELKVYAECIHCGTLVIEEESGDGDVYTTLESHCSLNNCGPDGN